MPLANQGSESSVPLSSTCVELHKTGGTPANTTCTPSTAIESSSQTENDGNQVKASKQKPVVSEFIIKDATKILSVAHDLKGNDASIGEGSLASVLTPVADLSKKGAADITTNGVRKRRSAPATTASKALTVSIHVVHNPNKRKLLCFIYSLCFLIEFPH